MNVNLELVRDGRVMEMGAADTLMARFHELGGRGAGYDLRPMGEDKPIAKPFSEWSAGDTVLMRSVAHGDKLIEVNFRGWNGDMGIVVSNGMQMSTHRSTLYHLLAEGVRRAEPMADTVDTAPVQAPAPRPVVAVVPTGTVTRTVREGQVSAEAAARVARHEAALKAMGIALPPPVYAPGSVVNATGVKNFGISRKTWEQSPETSAACMDIASAIRREDRQDITVPMGEVFMDDDGNLSIGRDTLALEDIGFLALAARIRKPIPDAADPGDEDMTEAGRAVFPYGVPLLREMEPEMRSEVWNTLLKGAGKGKLKLRTRLHGGGRQVFAVVGPRYSPMDADVVAESIAVAMKGAGTRGEVVYDSARAELRVDALYHADNVVDLSAGDVFKVGARFRTSDSGGGSIRGSAMAWRNRCLNLIIIGTGEVDLFRAVHKGDLSMVPSKIREAGAKMQEMFAGFAQEWGALRATPIDDVTLWGQCFSSVEQALTHGVEHGLITEAIAKDTALEVLLSGYRHEGGETLADMVNAVTRAAHASTLVDDCARSIMERDAGRLVHVLRGAVAEA